MTNTSFLMPLFKVLAFVVSVFAATNASAGVLTVDGSTLGGPTWHRPDANGVLSPDTDAVAYDVTHFQVTGTADFKFLSTAENAWDNYLFLYRISFDPAAPQTNLMIGNDNYPPEGTTVPVEGLSGFDYLSLVAGVDYFLVTTGYLNNDAGRYTAEISARDLSEYSAFLVSTSVPEPGSMALLGLGLVGLATVRRRLK